MKRFVKYFNNLIRYVFTKEDVLLDNSSNNSEILLGESDKKDYSYIKILIDNGHGINTIGKCSPYTAYKVGPNIEYKEYEWNREISSIIVKELIERGFNASLLVEEMRDVALSERVRRVNNICNEYGVNNVILISIHANASGNGSKWMTAKGWSAYTSKGNTKSDIIAEYLYKEAEKNFYGRKIRTDMSDGDRDWESNLYMCQKTKCPSVLTENFFYDNIDDVNYILSNEGKASIVKTHIDAIIKYIKDTY